jgi:hypothetical protein
LRYFTVLNPKEQLSEKLGNASETNVCAKTGDATLRKTSNGIMILEDVKSEELDTKLLLRGK